MASAKHWEQDKEATVYVGNLDERVTDALVWELMLQAGRIQNVHLPKDRVTQTHQGYGFVEFQTEEEAEYASKIMNQVRMYGKAIRVNKASADKQKAIEVGAELFVGNLDPMVDEKTLFDTFSRFGSILSAPKVARDDAGLSKGYGFVSFADFESSDTAIQNMHGQFLMNREISVQYAKKKDGKGERHGDDAERTLAAQARKNNVQPTAQPLPPQLFSTPAPAAPPMATNGDAHARPNGFPPQGAPPGYNNVPPPPGQARPPPQAHPLPPPPSGLPSRPPPSQAGYGGPPGFAPTGFSGGQQGAPPGFQPPTGFNAPPGFGPPPGQAPPPGMPPGFPQQQGGYGRR